MLKFPARIKNCRNY